MAWLFSKRCRNSLRDGRLKVSIPMPVRERIWMALNEYSECSSYQEEGSTITDLPRMIESELGNDALWVFSEIEEGERVRGDVHSIILRACWPPYVFDTLELFYQAISENSRTFFQKRFNEIMEESAMSWRMVEGTIFPVDSAYIEDVIIRKAYDFLHEVEFEGAFREFEKARADLSNGDYEGAIQNANLAVESTLKGILKKDRARPGELYRELIDSGMIPEYYTGFLKAFEENILRCVTIIRNEELGVGHGQGPNVNIIPPPLAELAVNLAGVMIVFLIKRHLEMPRN